MKLVTCKLPYVIAEVGSNHNGDLNQAIAMINHAGATGASAVKFQLFFADELYPDGTDLYRAVLPHQLDQTWLEPLIAAAKGINIDIGVSVFGEKSLAVAARHGFDFLKVASSEADNLPFIERVLGYERPTIISTGMCDLTDQYNLSRLIKRLDAKEVAILHCYSEYPLAEEDSAVSLLATLRELFDCPIGFSDHTETSLAAIVATGAGAQVFEKHVTLSRTQSGPDHSYATEFQEFKEYVDLLNRAYTLFKTDGDKDLTQSERTFGRRLGVYASKDLYSGDFLTLESIEVRRPALGLRARDIGSILFQRLRQNVNKGDPITWGAVK